MMPQSLMLCALMQHSRTKEKRVVHLVFQPDDRSNKEIEREVLWRSESDTVVVSCHCQPDFATGVSEGLLGILESSTLSQESTRLL